MLSNTLLLNLCGGSEYDRLSFTTHVAESEAENRTVVSKETSLIYTIVVDAKEQKICNLLWMMT